MTKLIFVHGVSTRRDPGFDEMVAARDRRFKEFAFEGGQLDITNPYWGDFGADPAWRLACIPAFTAKYSTLGLGQAPMLGVDPNGDVVLKSAQHDFATIVGGLSTVALEQAAAKGQAELETAEKFWSLATKFADTTPAPQWLAQIKTDKDFFLNLNQEVRAQAQAANVTLGFFDPVKAAADKLAGGLTDLVNGPIAKIAREQLTPKVAIFVGDVFEYLKAGSARTNIRAVVTDALVKTAREANATGEKLIVAGHSMGGVILYDLLSDSAAIAQISSDLGFNFKADLFLTIGSQVALFEELKVFTSSTATYSSARGNKMPMPKAATTWWNVFNKMDVLSFVTDPVFDGPVDFAVDTSAGVLDAHSAYFTNMMFYTRLNARLKAGGLA
jgi:hypothetical protein